MRREETRRMTITAVFAAILIMQTFVPNIGYVPYRILVMCESFRPCLQLPRFR